MRTFAFLLAAVLLGLLTGPAGAEDKPNPDQLKKAYDDALVQLKVAQDSKNNLAAENEKLAKQIDDLKKQLAGAQGQVENLRRQVSDNDQKTFLLRAYQGAWHNFLRAHPDLQTRWKAFLADDVLALPQDPLETFDLGIPLPTDGGPSEGG